MGVIKKPRKKEIVRLNDYEVALLDLLRYEPVTVDERVEEMEGYSHSPDPESRVFAQLCSNKTAVVRYLLSLKEKGLAELNEDRCRKLKSSK